MHYYTKGVHNLVICDIILFFHLLHACLFIAVLDTIMMTILVVGGNYTL